MSTPLAIDSFQPISLEEMKGVRLMNRIDTKYILHISQLPALLEKCAEFYCMQENNGTRLSGYRTMYYDTDAHDAYLLHLHGRAPRQKLRSRIYEDDGEAFFEIKNKTNQGRTKKKRVPIPQDCFQNFTKDSTALEFAEERARWSPSALSPALEIKFSRLTLVNFERTERITIDTSLEFFNPRSKNTIEMPQVAIVEIKRDGRCRSTMQDMLLRMRVFPAQISKYCTGMMLTDASLPRGLFKPRLVQLNKIINKYA